MAEVRTRPIGLSTRQEMTGARTRIQSWQPIRARGTITPITSESSVQTENGCARSWSTIRSGAA